MFSEHKKNHDDNGECRYTLPCEHYNGLCDIYDCNKPNKCEEYTCNIFNMVALRKMSYAEALNLIEQAKSIGNRLRYKLNEIQPVAGNDCSLQLMVDQYMSDIDKKKADDKYLLFDIVAFKKITECFTGKNQCV